ncbi:ferredoxin reductase [Lysobacter cavernae]|uniref:Ferredoxin reductase n=1 Tax=Lysobacter cavernae TaxID=1685901 RepID=A0ABV7RTQ6_9GAMM
MLTPEATRPATPARLRRLVQPLVPPALFDFWASRLHPTWSWQRPLARIVARQTESADAVTLLLQPNRHWAGALPGQHLNLGVEVDGVRVTRSYSLSDAVRADGRVAITVKAISGGRLSQHLCQRAQVGDVLELDAAFGDMTLPASPHGRWLFLAAGSGITPLMAMVRQLAAQGMPVPLTLVYWTRTRAERCFADELRALAAKHADFTVHFVLTREPATLADEGEGRIDAMRLSACVPDLDTRQVFACGPGGFVDQARALAAPQARSFHAEAFTPPPRLIGDTGTAQVTLAASGRTLTLPRGASLLAALEAAGLKPAAGCRMGICNTCACAKRSGTTRHLHTGEEVGEPVSALRLCVNSAASDLVIDL